MELQDKGSSRVEQRRSFPRFDITEQQHRIKASVLDHSAPILGYPPTLSMHAVSNYESHIIVYYYCHYHSLKPLNVISCLGRMLLSSAIVNWELCP